MNHNDELMRYQEDAEEQFDDFHSDDMASYDGYDDDMEEEEDEEFDDYDEEYEDEDGYIDDYEDEEYDDFRSGGRTSKHIDPNDRTLTVRVRNDSDKSGEAILFGANQEADQLTGVVVDVEESSHKEVREESKANPFKIQGMKYSVSDSLQFDNVLKIVNRTASGSNTTQVWQPRNSSSPQNFNPLMIDSETFTLNVSGRSSLRFIINAKTTAVFTFTIRARANMGNLLEGHNIAELSSAPRTTGLPQIDLLRRRRRAAVVARRRRRPSRSIRPRRAVKRLGRSSRARVLKSRLIPKKRTR